MSSRHHIHHRVWLKQLHFKRLKGLWGIYLSSIFRVLGWNLIGIFIPIYIFKITSNIPSIFIFYFIYHLTVVLMTVPTGSFMKKNGVDKTAAFGALLRAVMFILLIYSSKQKILLWLAAVFLGITTPLIWLPYHYTVVAEEDGDGKFGKEVSYLSIIEKFASALAPFVGGLVIWLVGFSALYWLSFFLVIASALPLLFDRFNKKDMSFDPAGIFSYIKDKKYDFLTISFLGLILENEIFAIVRPLFVYLILFNTASLGVIESVAVTLSIVVAWWAGKWVDKKGFGIMKIGVAANALALLLVPFLSKTLAFALHNSFYLIISVLIWTPFAAATYKLALIKRKLEFFGYREIVIHAGGAIICLFLAVFSWLGLNWIVLFGFGSIGLLLTLTILKGEKNGSSQGVTIHPATA